MTKRLAAMIFSSLLLAAALAAAVWAGGRRSYQTTVFAMDTVVEVRFYGRRAEAAAQEFLSRVRRLEEQLSPYDPQSAVAALNGSAGSGEPVAMPEEAFALLEKAQRYGAQSGGTFSPLIGPLVELWGVTGDAPRVPESGEIAAALGLCGGGDLILDGAARTARLCRKGARADLGGIAKGEAALMAFEVMDAFGIENGFVSLGGNLAVRGVRADTGEDFLFGVRDPRGAMSEMIGTIRLRGLTMATTGDYERYFEQDGARYHHVFDPRTGYPARGGLISVSVVCPDGALADFLSTALFVAGRDTVLARCMNDERFSVIAVDEGLHVYVSPSLRGVFEPARAKPQYRFTFVGEGESP